MNAILSPLWQQLKGYPQFEKGLFWCHTTKTGALMQILHEGKFRPNFCPHFKRELIFFFYGRPAYRVARADMTDELDWPVVLVFNHRLMEFGNRLFPFDTGAFFHGRYEGWIDSRTMPIEEFELLCMEEGPRRHVTAFFGTNREYLRTKPLGKLHGTGNEVFGAHFGSIVGLLHSKTRDGVDDRRLAVELQLQLPVEIDAEYLSAVIYPDQIADSPWMKLFVERMKDRVRFEGYIPMINQLTNDHQALLENKSYGIQFDMGLI